MAMWVTPVHRRPTVKAASVCVASFVLMHDVCARPSAERPITVRYQLAVWMQQDLLRIAHAKSWLGAVDLRKYYEESSVVFQRGCSAALYVRSHVLAIRDDAANRELITLILVEQFGVAPRCVVPSSENRE